MGVGVGVFFGCKCGLVCGCIRSKLFGCKCGLVCERDKYNYLDLRKRNLFGHEMNLMMISKVNQALQTHSTKKKAS